MGFTLPSSNAEEENCRCNCGFSAIVNRRMSHQAGLFYEDEVEIAGAGSTRDPAQFKRGSLYSLCHTDKDEHEVLMRSRLLDLIQGVSTNSSSSSSSSTTTAATTTTNTTTTNSSGSSLIDRKPLIIKSEKDMEKSGDMVSSTIAAVVMESSAPSVDNLPVALMELLREQCLLLHHASSPLYRAEQLQAANRKSSILHALELSDSCDTAKNALTLALYNSPPSMPSSSPIHPQQPPPPPYQQHQQQQQQQQQHVSSISLRFNHQVF